MSNDAPLLVLKSISKSFGGVHALESVDLSIHAGEVHCLAGTNGSGKSTLIKIISGVYTPDSGVIEIQGQNYKNLTPIQALNLGIQVIYQDFSVFPNLTVAENLVFTNLIKNRKHLVSWNDLYIAAQKSLDKLNIKMDLKAPLGSLTVAQKQLVVIARAMQDNVRLIIMDEPTTALTQKEVNALFALVNRIKAQGITFLFVSHKMKEMMEISDTVSILRNAKVVGKGQMSEFTEEKLTFLMTGQQLKYIPYVRDINKRDKPKLVIKNLNDKENNTIRNINMTLYSGEIVGLIGLMGSGRTSILQAIFGSRTVDCESMTLDGIEISTKDYTIQKAIHHGIAYIPEDRLAKGLFLPQSITRNFLASIYDRIVNKLWFIKSKKGDDLVNIMIKNLALRLGKPDDPVHTLSGGNQQRVLIGRWLLTKPKILLLNGPTVGVDVGSKAEIHEVLRNLAVSQNVTILMSSDDIGELIYNCNRILGVRQGALVQEFSGSNMTEEVIDRFLKEAK